MKNQFHVEVNVDEDEGKKWVALVCHAVKNVLIQEAVEQKYMVSVLLTNDQTMRKLNDSFMGLKETTDVLSFPAGTPIPGLDDYLGDIAISIPQAKHQAGEAGHTIAEELKLLTVHATLHLLGYDHDTAEEKQKMWSIQDSIISNLENIAVEDNV